MGGGDDGEFNYDPTLTILRSTQLCIVHLPSFLITARELTQVQDEQELEPLLERGPTHDAKQLAEATETHLPSTCNVHQLEVGEWRGV